MNQSPKLFVPMYHYDDILADLHQLYLEMRSQKKWPMAIKIKEIQAKIMGLTLGVKNVGLTSLSPEVLDSWISEWEEWTLKHVHNPEKDYQD